MNESSADSNPYASPPTAEEPRTYVDVIDFQIDSPVHFEGEVTKRDVVRALRNPQNVVAFSILLGITVAIGLAVAWPIVLNGRNLAPVHSMGRMASLVVLFAFYELWANSGVPAATRRLRLDPDILGPISGQFVNDTIRIIASGTDTTLRARSITGLKIQRDSIAITTDMGQESVCVFPARFFSRQEFEQLSSMFQPYVARFPIHRNYRVVGDERVGNWEFPESESETPVSAIPYSGITTLGDIAGTEYQRESIRFVLSFHLRNLSFYVIPLAVTYGLGLIGGVVVVGFLALRYHGIPLIIQVWRIFRLASYSEFALMKCRGWVSDSALKFENPLGATLFEWHAFDRCEIRASVVVLTLPGSAPRSIGLSRGQFGSDEAWREFVAIVESNFDSSKTIR